MSFVTGLLLSPMAQLAWPIPFLCVAVIALRKRLTRASAFISLGWLTSLGVTKLVEIFQSYYYFYTVPMVVADDYWSFGKVASTLITLGISLVISCLPCWWLYRVLSKHATPNNRIERLREP